MPFLRSTGRSAKTGQSESRQEEKVVTSEQDVPDVVDNPTIDSNDAGEMVWGWRPNGRLTPSGIRLMRLIRNGDTDFDGDVDLDDFIPMPRCFTGPVVTDGLCECRFFDIDHDRDVDMDDYNYFLRNYTGPLEDCNNNGIVDLEELLAGTASDCNLNGRIDTCEGLFNLDPVTCAEIPAVSTWGLTVMSLLLLAAATLLLRTRPQRLEAITKT